MATATVQLNQSVVRKGYPKWHVYSHEIGTVIEISPDKPGKVRVQWPDPKVGKGKRTWVKAANLTVV